GVRARSIGTARLTCTDAERTDDPGPGKADAARPVRIAVTIPAAPWPSALSARALESAKAAVQARTSPACSVRCTEAVSPGRISSKVLLTTVCIPATPLDHALMATTIDSGTRSSTSSAAQLNV